jgi:hypothetical protein
MGSRIRNQMFYATLGIIFASVCTALVPLAIGQEMHRSAKSRVARARRRVKRAGASIARRLRFAS